MTLSKKSIERLRTWATVTHATAKRIGMSAEPSIGLSSTIIALIGFHNRVVVSLRLPEVEPTDDELVAISHLAHWGPARERWNSISLGREVVEKWKAGGFNITRRTGT